MELRKIKLGDLIADKNNVRDNLEDIDELADSIQKNGQITAVMVEDLGDGHYFITDGHRRQAAFKLIKNRTKTEPLVNCIVSTSMSELDRLIKRAALDAQTKLLSIPERDKVWKQIWDAGDYSGHAFARLIGVNRTTIADFLDRVALSPDIKRFNANPSILKETKYLKPDRRAKLIKYALKNDIGKTQVRISVSKLKDVSDKVFDAFVDEKIDLQTAEKLDGLSDDKTQDAIDIIGGITKNIKRVPKVIANTEKTTEPERKKIMRQNEFINKLKKEILGAGSQMIALTGILDQIEEEKWDIGFSKEHKQSLNICLDELSKTIQPAVDRIKKSMDNWRRNENEESSSKQIGRA